MTFWTPENLAKEKNLGLSRTQVYALASIVQKESGGKPDEQKKNCRFISEPLPQRNETTK